jgi:hypothetical protein
LEVRKSLLSHSSGGGGGKQVKARSGTEGTERNGTGDVLNEESAY